MIAILLAALLAAPANVAGLRIDGALAPASQPALRTVFIESEAGEVLARYRLPIPADASCLTLVVEEDGVEREEHFTFGEVDPWAEETPAPEAEDEPLKPRCGECLDGHSCRVRGEPNCCVNRKECVKCKVCAKRQTAEEP